MSRSSSLLIPFTFKNLPNGDDCQLLNTSFSLAQARVVKNWGSWNPVGEGENFAGDDSQQGVLVVGCEDGTIYMFSPSQKAAFSGPAPLPTHHSQPCSPIQTPLRSQAPSRASIASPTTTVPFNVAPRSTVVSGVTTEQVEAPKNYVDFDDEPGKLKKMLRGRSQRNGRDKLSAIEVGAYNSLSRDLSPTPSLGSRRKATPKSLLSPVPLTPLRFGTPSSASFPLHEMHHEMACAHLWCRIITSRRNTRAAVTSICLLPDADSFAVLQEVTYL